MLTEELRQGANRVERNFPPGARVVLEVLDFPALDPPERRWRWQAPLRTEEGGEEALP